MSHEIALQLTKNDGSVEQRPQPRFRNKLTLDGQRLTAVSNNIAELTHVTALLLNSNFLTAIPTGMFGMTQLKFISLAYNRLVAIPPEIGLLTVLRELYLDGNALAAVPREIGRLTALQILVLGNNALTAVPPELGLLPVLRGLDLHNNRLKWLPLELERLPPTTEIFLDNNPLKIRVGRANAFPLTNSRSKLPKLFAATTALAMIREPAINILTALQDLGLPALLLVELLDAAFPNSIRMHKKWDLVTAVKHFHQRRGIDRVPLPPTSSAHACDSLLSSAL